MGFRKERWMEGLSCRSVLCVFGGGCGWWVILYFIWGWMDVFLGCWKVGFWFSGDEILCVVYLGWCKGMIYVIVI